MVKKLLENNAIFIVKKFIVYKFHCKKYCDTAAIRGKNGKINKKKTNFKFAARNFLKLFDYFDHIFLGI